MEKIENAAAVIFDEANLTFALAKRPCDGNAYIASNPPLTATCLKSPYLIPTAAFLIWPTIGHGFAPLSNNDKELF